MLQKQSRSRSNPRGLLRSGSSPPGREVVPPKLRAQVHPPKGRTTYMCTAGHRPSGKILATQRCLEAAANMSTSCMELTENAVACESRATNCPSASGRSTNLKFKMRKKDRMDHGLCLRDGLCPSMQDGLCPSMRVVYDRHPYIPGDTARHPETSRDIPETLPRHPRDTPETPLRHPRDIPETLPRHPETSPRHPRDTPETPRDSRPRHPETSPDTPGHPGDTPRQTETPQDPRRQPRDTPEPPSRQIPRHRHIPTSPSNPREHPCHTSRDRNDAAHWGNTATPQPIYELSNPNPFYEIYLWQIHCSKDVNTVYTHIYFDLLSNSQQIESAGGACYMYI